MKKTNDLYLMKDEEEEGAVCCDRCDATVSDNSELYPYFEIMVCDCCLDKLRIRDEKESFELENSLSQVLN